MQKFSLSHLCLKRCLQRAKMCCVVHSSSRNHLATNTDTCSHVTQAAVQSSTYSTQSQALAFKVWVQRGPVQRGRGLVQRLQKLAARQYSVARHHAAGQRSWRLGRCLQRPVLLLLLPLEISAVRRPPRPPCVAARGAARACVLGQQQRGRAGEQPAAPLGARRLQAKLQPGWQQRRGPRPLYARCSCQATC